MNHRWGYVRSEIHTNGIENCRSLKQQGLNGIYHQVNEKHLHRYYDQYVCKLNERKNCHQEKFNTLVFQADGRSLTYKRLIARK